ncbi:hyaluronate lyase N-terminal domain-containing protein [Paenibacillus sp. FSL R7-0128]|uniref:hyaluronate lyase N-terminal domain-containing protein n=1 Tax=Paenibacillus sp. FSL R7-0128 TaxID=2954529 RepID=UPI0030FC8DC1
MANKIQVRRGTKAQLAAHGPLDAGEPGYITDTRELVIGSGTGVNTPLVSATSADITYYVRTDGSDTNTGLANTAGGAFKTIGKATSLIPQIVNHAVTINIAAGTYNELVEIHGRSGKSSITLNGTGTTTYVKSVYMFGVQQANINNLTATDAGQIGFYFHSGGWAQFSGCVSTTATANDGFNVSYQCGVLRNCVVSNKTGAAISCNSGTITVDSCTGTGNAIAFYGDNSASITTKGTTVPAGASFVGSASVLNPWGDNTTSSRTGIFAYKTTAQATLAASYTKIILPNRSPDYLLEWNPTTSVFTAAKTGIYLIIGKCLFSSVPAGTTLETRVWRNGGVESEVLARTIVAAAGDTLLTGTITRFLNAGDVLEYYAYTSTAQTIASAADSTSLQIYRLS